jgi:hypothetical protein
MPRAWQAAPRASSPRGVLSLALAKRSWSMFRHALWIAAAVSIGAVASAQDNLRSRLKPISSPVRYAGTFHLGTGTWTRGAHHAAIGTDVIYNNTCATGYYGFMEPTETWTDEGRVPSITSPDTSTSKPGCANAYVVDGFQIGYCSSTPTTQIIVSFFQSYAPCTDSSTIPPTASFTLSGLPGSSAGVTCWTVDVDLATPPSNPFPMLADGDGQYNGGDTFGWSIQIPNSGGQDGPMIAGGACSAYASTVFAPVFVPGQGTGMDTLDRFRIDGNPMLTPGCYFFGGDPFASFHLLLFTTAACAPEPGSGFCFGDGSGTACPCGNAGHVGFGQGCDNSEGHPARLTALGVASIAHDTLVLRAAGMTTTTFAVFMQATAKDNGGAGSVSGDGLSCISGTSLVVGSKPGSNGVALYPHAGDPAVSVVGGVTAGATRYYQAWYRDAASFCTASSLNTTNGYQVVWAP